MNSTAHIAQPITMTIAGPLGANAYLASRILALSANQAGWHLFGLPQQSRMLDFDDTSLTISSQVIGCLNEKSDLLVCVDAAAWERHVGSLAAQAIVLVDADISITIPRRKKLRIIRLPIARLAREIGGHPRTRISVIAAAIAALADIPFIELQPALELAIAPSEILGHIRVAKAAYQAIQAQDGRLAMPAKSAHRDNLLTTGAQAAAIGSIASGVTFISYAQFANPVVEHLQTLQDQYAIVLQKSADQTQSAGQALGAAIAGARALIISNSSIEQLAESFKAAAISETPLVFLQCANNTESNAPDQQAAQIATCVGGDVPHVVIAPSNGEELFALIQDAFNTAENLQTPVILLCDQQILASFQTVTNLMMSQALVQRGQLMTAKQARSVSQYQRYALTADGISPRKVPGQAGELFAISAFNHNQTGQAGSITDYVNQAEKRLHKIRRLRNIGLPYIIHGPSSADVTIVCIGSVVGAAIRASQMLCQDQIPTNVLQLTMLAPFPAEQVHQIFRGSKHLLLAEADTTAQLGQLIRQETGIGFHHKLLMPAGSAVYPERIVKTAKRIFTHG